MSELLSGMDVVLYKKGKAIFESNERIKKFYFVREGKVGLFDDSDLVGTAEKDEIIEASTSLSKITTEHSARALEDSIIFEFDITRVEKILQKNLLFKEFIEKLISGKLLSLLKLADMSESSIYEKRVSIVINKSPVFCFKDQTLRETIELMNRNDVGSVIVVDPEVRPIGILTHSDILRSIEKETPLTTSVERVMSRPVITIESEESIMDAYLKFLSHGINHLAVVDNEKLVGVISIKDLIYNLESRSHFFKISKDIIRSKDLEELKNLSIRINSLIKNASAYGFSYPSISYLVTTIVDAVLRKALSRFEPCSGMAIVLTGDYGKREFDIPLTIDLLIIGDEKFKGTISNYIEILSNSGLQIGNVQLCFDDPCKFLNSLPFSKLLEILDARFIFGDRIMYIKFKNALKDLPKQNTFLAKVKTLFGDSTIEYRGIVQLISNGIKVAGYIYGDPVSRPTWERLKVFESRGIMKKELAEDLTEAYLTLRTVELSIKTDTKKELLDRIIYKKIIKVVMEYKLWMKDLLGWG
ncbi:MAG: CBS domain-containing protein [Candidatus Methanomethyliaceae archaeon]|nr:CBS domain-containing protein [Candidatus Methanomethyliaceae archaeon]